MRGLEQAQKSIMEAKEIIISGHINPDGDSIGSLLSVGLGLERLGKRVHMVSADGVPKKYRLLPGARRIMSKAKRPADLAIAVDCSNREILGPTFDIFKRSKHILEIDHHDFRRPFGDMVFMDADAAAVGELIYLLLENLNINITDEIAQNLLVSIIVETDSFRLPNVRAVTFEVCTELIKRGVDFYKLTDMVFWSRTRESAILSGICLARCKFINGGKIAWSMIRAKDFRKVKGRDEDVDAVADEIRSIKEVEIAVLFREKGAGALRVSLRSKNKINIASIAERYNGGGHYDVAGCTIPNNKRSMREVLGLAAGLL